MADAGVARDPGRLPWLEPYRAPIAARKSNRRPGTAVIIGAVGLAAVVTLLARDVIPLPTAVRQSPQASVVLPAPADMQAPIVIAPIEPLPTVEVASAATPAATYRAKPRVQRKIKTVPTSAA